MIVRLGSVLALAMWIPSMSAQSFKEQFGRAVQAQDVAQQRVVLDEWGHADADDAELYVAWFNFYFLVARRDGIILGNEPGDGPVLEITDPDSSEPVGYIYGDQVYDMAVLDSGFFYIDSGIVKYPQRLDMRFGKIHALGLVEAYGRYTDEVVRTIEHGARTDYRWTWTGNEPVEDPQAFMLDGTQQYVHELFSTGDDARIPDMERIALTVLAHVPDHVPSLSTLGSVYLMNGELDKGLDQFLRAEKLAPTDDIVTANIAEAYKRKGDKASAITYYERTYELGDAEMKAYAREQIAALKL